MLSKKKIMGTTLLISWVRIFYVPGYKIIRLGTSLLGYESSWVRIFHKPCTMLSHTPSQKTNDQQFITLSPNTFSV